MKKRDSALTINRLIWSVSTLVFIVSFASAQLNRRAVKPATEIRFQHHYVDADLPRGGADATRFNYGQTALVDLDRDGDLDFITGQQEWAGGNLYWYEYQRPNQWVRHELGRQSPSDVGGAALDVDGDGWSDFVTGGAWYRNPRNPRSAPFTRIVFDDKLKSVHDVVVADLNRDRKPDIVTMSDKNNLRWYRIPADPTQPWQRTDIGASVHAGIAPAGVGDLDGDGDADIMRTNVWFENADGKGTKWIEHPNVPFGLTGGSWPLASRSIICDLDKDGDNDVVVSDNEYNGGKVAWLENVGGRGRNWQRHDLPTGDAAKRGAYHSLAVSDFDRDNDLDVFSVEMESQTDFIRGERPPRFFLWENLDGKGNRFAEHVILNARLGGHEAVVGDVDRDGDADIVSKIWSPQRDNAVGGKGHADFLENLHFNSAASSRATANAQSFRLSQADEAFLEDLSRRSFRYFQEQTDPKTGLVLDRARTDASIHDEGHRNTASIAATGFGLTGWCIAAERGWVSQKEAREMVRTTLRFFAEQVKHDHGWFWHWMDWRNGERVWKSEVSSIDTALLLGGVLTARQYFRGDKEIVRLATKIYERIDFQWMLNGDPYLLSHGLREETGFIKHRWGTYSEHASLYLLAIGSPTHPIKPESWYAWKRNWIEYGAYKFLSGGAPLFIHQYPHAWVDFRGRRETKAPHVDYFENSVIATRAHKAFCLDLAKEFPGYTENIWGVTASDSAKGYVAWGGPPRHPRIDGTVVPCAAGGSLMFAPDITLPALREMKEKFGDKVYGRYAFVDAFNPNNGWINPDVIGIDVGITLLSAENLRSGNVWRWFMRNSEIPRAMKRIGLVQQSSSPKSSH